MLINYYVINRLEYTAKMTMRHYVNFIIIKFI